MKFAFIVTSAVNTKFGVFNTEQRMQQTRSTVDSIRKRVPKAMIVILESSGPKITDAQRTELTAMSDYLYDCSGDESVAAIYESTDNWDIVKNSCEVLCFGQAIKDMHSEQKFADVDRVFKISGRYTLNDMFDPTTYEQTDVADKIVVSRVRQSQFNIQITQVPLQYMSRLWSWPTAITDQIIDVYDRGFQFIAQRYAEGGYCDIEHMLYKFLPSDHVHQLDHVGIEGNIGPNGTFVKD